MSYDATVMPHDSVTTTLLVWRGELIWNFGVLQGVRFLILLQSLVINSQPLNRTLI
jgi:hypothetical protein